MDGRFVVRVVERALADKGISKGQFYEQSGISSATFSQWRTGKYEPSAANLKAIEDLLGVHFVVGYDPAVASGLDTELDELIKKFRTRDEYRMLFRSIDGLPTSAIYEVIAFVERSKESGWGRKVP